MKKLLLSLPLCAGATAAYLAYPISHEEPKGPPYQLLPKASYHDHPNKHFITKIPKKVGVVGGGIAGAIVAKTLTQQGYDVEVLEQNSGAGGLWWKNYDGCGLQLPYPHYNLPDFEFPEGTEQLPRLDKVKKFVEDYMTTFNLWPLFKFNTEVVEISQKPDETWSVRTHKGEKKDYDFLILCTGPYNKPHMPHLSGIEKFKGKVIHNSEFINAKEWCQGKKVVIIGSGKSAFDILGQAYKYGAQPTIVMRKAHHFTPIDQKVYGIPLGNLASSRFGFLFQYPFYCEKSFIHKYFKWLGDAYWKVLENALNEDLPSELVPTAAYKNEKFFRGGSRERDIFNEIKNGNLKVVRGSVESLTENGVKVGNKIIEADLVVCATGYDRNYFGLQAESDGLWMYRNTLIPDKKNFAVVGITNTYCNPLYTNMQTLWLAEVLRGRVNLPGYPRMIDDIKQRRDYTRTVINGEDTISFSWFSYPTIDQFVRDMGLETKRKPNNYAFWFEPIKPSDYKSVVTHRV